MKSMTGFSSVEKQFEDGRSVSVEIKSYNNRFLEMYINLSPHLCALEPRIRALINERCRRGKIEITIREKKRGSLFSVRVNTEVLGSYLGAIKEITPLIQNDTRLEQTIPLGVLLNFEGVLELDRNEVDINEEWAGIKDIFEETFFKFETERVREGKHTQENILHHLAVLEKSGETIASFVPALEQSIKETIQKRFAELCETKIDENRVLAETAILLMKWTISEELSRLNSHLGEFRAEIARNESPGKKLDFLCQEINREVNTIGSKSQIPEVSRLVVTMKEALENIREQLRNVE
jgi:uncharacterized protein (TIGR00255 family)